MDIHTLISTINSLLKPELFQDYCPNGLQVEGNRPVKKIACAVTASQQVIEQAIGEQADMLLVHHGFFWKGESAVITGTKKKRIASLLSSGIHLVAYHLPLDAHHQLGNNAQLALRLRLQVERRIPDTADSLLFMGRSQTDDTVRQLADTISTALKRKPLVIGEKHQRIRNIAWCTGAAQGFFDQAIAQGVDAYITGEVSEQNYHQAHESGVCFIAAGHHATERYGVQALTEQLCQKYALQWCFLDQSNPV